MYPLDDTIVAIASPPGGAARGIVRLSGPRAFECLTPLLSEFERPASPCVIAGSLRLPGLVAPLPSDVYLWPHRGYTGQPTVEIHTIGSPPLLQILLRSLCGAGARLAQRGEFTLRAFLAGRIDLTQAEAVLGVIDAADTRALDAALAQLAGGLARPLDHLRDALLELLAHVEAAFDFADEDLTFITHDELGRRLADAEGRVAALVHQMDSRAEPLEAAQVALVGRPNAGKSSLFNALLGASAALVSHGPGTTRDYLAARLDLDGVQCRLIDTAGVDARECLGDIDATAQSVAQRQRRAAQVVVLCIDATRPGDERLQAELATDDLRRIVVLTKCDLPHRNADPGAIETSTATGFGIDALRERLRHVLLDDDHAGDVVASTAARCRESLRLARESLGRARQVAASGQEELAAAELRVALNELGKVVGAVYTDDVLDRIFSRFCVGK